MQFKAVWLLALSVLRPFVKAVGGNKAAPAFERFPERGLLGGD
jgi:hypothetical protein